MSYQEEDVGASRLKYKTIFTKIVALSLLNGLWMVIYHYNFLSDQSGQNCPVVFPSVEGVEICSSYHMFYSFRGLYQLSIVLKNWTSHRTEDMGTYVRNCAQWEHRRHKWTILQRDYIYCIYSHSFLSYNYKFLETLFCNWKWARIWSRPCQCPTWWMLNIFASECWIFPKGS